MMRRLAHEQEPKFFAMEKRADLDEECNFLDLAPEEIEAACIYEYSRESQALQNSLRRRPERGPALPASYLSELRFGNLVAWVTHLRAAAFPKPWKKLSTATRETLVSAWADALKGEPKLIIENVTPQWDAERITTGEPLWLLDNYEVRRGLIRVTEACNETEAMDEFRRWFREERPPTRGGNRKRWAAARLRDLTVMRLWKQFPSKLYGRPVKRIEHVAKFTELKGCRTFWDQLRNARREKEHVPAEVPNAAKVEMSSARKDALRFFQTLFPGEKPLSFCESDEGKS